MNRQEKQDWVRRYVYPRVVKNLWFKIVQDNVTPDSEILEIGSGSGRGLQNQLYPKAARIVGLDVDSRVLDNPHLDLGLHLSAYEITEDVLQGKVDFIYSHMVAEHIDDAERFLIAQLAVLKPGGRIVHSTVSKYYWTSMVNDFIPERIKNFLIKHIGSGRASEDVFEAHYQLNDQARIAALKDKFGFDYEIIRQDEAPGYLSRSIILMLIYSLIHKPLQLIFAGLRPTFIVLIKT